MTTHQGCDAADWVVADRLNPGDAPENVREISERTLREHDVQWSEVAYVATTRPSAADAMSANTPPNWLIVHRGPMPEPGDVVTSDGRWSGSAAVRRYLEGTAVTTMTVTTSDHASVVTGPAEAPGQPRA